MDKKFQIGDSAYLKEPYLGYRYVDIIDYDGDRLLVRLTSGLEISVREDELED